MNLKDFSFGYKLWMVVAVHCIPIIRQKKKNTDKRTMVHELSPIQVEKIDFNWAPMIFTFRPKPLI